MDRLWKLICNYVKNCLLLRSLFHVVFLWIVSSLPIIILILDSVTHNNETTTHLMELVKLRDSLIYTSVFLAPVFLMIVTRFWEQGGDFKSSTGDLIILVLAILIISVSSYFFNGMKGKDVEVNNIGIVLYLLSLALWCWSYYDSQRSKYSSRSFKKDIEGGNLREGYEASK